MAVHSRRAATALARLPEVDPAIAALSLWCQYRDSEGPTMTEGEIILVGPEFPLLPISEQTGLIAHHILHVALRHSARRTAAAERYGPRFQVRHYDLACDALVNEALLQAQHALPRPAVRASEIIAKLPPADQPQNVLAEWDCDQLYAAIATQGGASGQTQGEAIERYAEAQNFQPDLKGIDPHAKEPEVWAGRIEQALQAGKRAGSGIGAVLARFGDLPRATVPWEVRLRRLLAKALAQHPAPSHRRPARGWLARDSLARQAGTPFPAFEPALRRDARRPRLVIGLDTSSSIPEPVLELFASEALSISRRTGAETTLLGFDTEVHSRGRLTSLGDISRLDLRRGGGTDFGPLLRDAAALDPSLVIVLTDLDAPTPTDCAADILWVAPVPPQTMPRCGAVLIMDDSVHSRQNRWG